LGSRKKTVLKILKFQVQRVPPTKKWVLNLILAIQSFVQRILSKNQSESFFVQILTKKGKRNRKNKKISGKLLNELKKI
jgi:hypothetical protein